MKAEGESPPAESSNDELTCPLCGYSLRGLIDPRCPECGHAFDWAKLRDQRLRLHPYLFEHHPKHNLWSFLKTVSSSQPPLKFWRTLQPIHDCVTRRLLLYWFVGAILPLLALAIEITNVSLPRTSITITRPGYRGNYSALVENPIPRGHAFEVDRPNWGQEITGENDEIRWLLEEDTYLTPMLFLAGLGIFWPWLTLLPLLIFRQSMRKARVRAVHLLRCVVYSAGVVFYPGFIAVFLTAAMLGMGPYFQLDITSLFIGLAILAYGMACLGLLAAFRRYLHFPHAFAVVVTSQVIAILLVGSILPFPTSLAQIINELLKRS